MSEQISFQCRVNSLLRIVDIFGYGNISHLNYELTKSGSIFIACDMIDSAKKLGAKEISEERMKLTPQNNQLGISFSLIFKDNRSLEAFLNLFFTR